MYRYSSAGVSKFTSEMPLCSMFAFLYSDATAVDMRDEGLETNTSLRTITHEVFAPKPTDMYPDEEVSNLGCDD